MPRIRGILEAGAAENLILMQGHYPKPVTNGNVASAAGSRRRKTTLILQWSGFDDNLFGRYHRA